MMDFGDGALAIKYHDSPEHHDFIVDYSVMHGGWCVYDQVACGDYSVVAGPFDYVGKAEYAREEMMNEL